MTSGTVAVTNGAGVAGASGGLVALMGAVCLLVVA
jgi:hypothetical protein